MDSGTKGGAIQSEAGTIGFIAVIFFLNMLSRPGLAHCFFAALNGILITFRDYPGRIPEDVQSHMKLLAQMTARLFEQGSAGWK